MSCQSRCRSRTRRYGSPARRLRRSRWRGGGGSARSRSHSWLRRKLLRFETSNIDQVILLNQAGKNTHEHICESLELFAREVMPELHAKIPEHEEWKQKVLAREIELEEIDTQPFRDRYGPNSVQITRPQAAE